ncbi:MAG: hypothetical protein A3G87_01885 [Omnitrophica bacterium RIFCSPLOWO2_12_FULL_50_11]|nr:MAG: hypothetical protein A3G87_01885 [Omnitrophica bacterium RIFCSPLOWO2_12_FULL_50_11]
MFSPFFVFASSRIRRHCEASDPSNGRSNPHDPSLRGSMPSNDEVISDARLLRQLLGYCLAMTGEGSAWIASSQ